MDEIGQELQLSRHKLLSSRGKAFRFEKTKNLDGKLKPKYLVMHYTAGTTTAGAVAWLTRKDSQASAHIIIGKDGEIVQVAPLDRITYHAGQSFWEGFHWLNRYSIGIELVNAGRLKWDGRNWNGGGQHNFSENDIVKATHKFDSKEYGWEIFPEAQLEKAVLVARKLIEVYNLVDVIGHDDISPLRKWDPGPAFPMDSFRSKVMGRKMGAQVILKTKGVLKLQSEPKPVSQEVVPELLPNGTIVELLDRVRDWTQVILLDPHDDQDGLMGWLPSRHLVREFSLGKSSGVIVEGRDELKPE